MFDGETWLGNLSLGTPADNGAFSMSFWVNWPEPTIGGFDAGNIVTVDPENSYTPNFVLHNVAIETPPYYVEFDTSPVSMVSATGAEGEQPNPVTPNAWHHVLVSWETNHTTKIFKIYIDGVDCSFGSGDSGTSDIIPFDGLPFYFAGDSYEGDGCQASFAEVWIAPGVSLLSAGDIPSLTRLKFRDADGKPVDLGAVGATPTGTAPAIFFSGNAASFATNKGTGGAFTVFGNTLTNASTSPSD